METKKLTPELLEIQSRFFNAIETMIRRRKLAGLNTFCRQFNLNGPKYSNLRSAWRDPAKQVAYKLIDMDALYYLVRYYNVSSDYLLLGKGPMFKETSGPIERKRELVRCD